MVYAAAEIKIHKLLLNVAWIKKIRLDCQETTVHQRPNISKQLNGSMGRWINTVPHNKLWKAPTCRCKTIHTIKQVACVMHKRINERQMWYTLASDNQGITKTLYGTSTYREWRS